MLGDEWWVWEEVEDETRAELSGSGGLPVGV
jgi:hypothetical protein